MPSARQANAPTLAPVFTPANDPSLHAPSKLAIAGAFVAVVAIIIALIAHFLAATNPVTHKSGAVGSQAPNFTVTVWNSTTGSQGAQASTVSLASLRGHPVVIFFWSEANLQSQGVAPTMESLYNQYHMLGVDFVGVAVATKDTDGQAFVKQTGLTFPNGPDTTGAITNTYSLAGTPSTVYIDPQGKIVYKLEGETDAGMLDYAIRMYLLDGMPPISTPGA